MTTRTPKQNNSLHLWCEQSAKVLNDAGIDMRIFFEKINYLNAEWTKEGFKEKVWKAFQKPMTGEDSTTNLDTVAPSEICKNITKAIAEATGVTLPPWPSEYEQSQAANNRRGF